MKTTSWPAFAVLALLVSVAPAARADDAEQPRTITTTGESVVYVAPDEIVVGLGVETFDASLDEARSANEAASRKLLAAIKGVGVEDKHVQTDTLSLEIRYRNGHPASGIEGYFARRAYSVTLTDTKKVEPLIEAALKNGANSLMGIDYRTTELRKHRDHARKMAIKAAKEKGTELAGELDCKLGPPRTISEGGGGYYSGYGGARWGGRQGYVMAQNSFQVAGGDGEGGETTPLGHVGVRAHVTVVFDLIPPAAAAAAAE